MAIHARYETAVRSTSGRRRPVALALLSLTLGLAACAGSPHDGAPSDESLAVGRFASDDPGSVNLHWINGPEGLIIVDGLRTVPDAEKALEDIRDADEKVAAIVVTHAHPDHVGGLGVLHDAFPEAPIYAGKTTAHTMETDAMGFYELTREIDGDDYPDRIEVPDHVIDADQPVTVGGLKLDTVEFGPGETDATTVFYEPKSATLFSGDLINNGMTPAMIEGNTCGWLADLDELATEFPDADKLYPGHGEPGNASKLIEAQRDYLTFVRDAVGEAVATDSAKGATVTKQETEAIIADIDDTYAGYQPVASLPDLHQANIAAVAKELLAADAPEKCEATS